jgi:hypothetical protein
LCATLAVFTKVLPSCFLWLLNGIVLSLCFRVTQMCEMCLGMLWYLTLSGNLWALTFWHRRFTFNSNKSPTWCNNFSVYYLDVCLYLNMFRAFSRPSSGAQWLQWQPLVLPSYRGDSRPVIELLMMGGETPETRWTVNKRKDNKVKNSRNRLVIYFNCTMMHGLTNLKFYI